MESILYVEQEQVTCYAEKKRVKNVRPCESDWLVFTERLKYFMLFMTKGLSFRHSLYPASLSGTLNLLFFVINVTYFKFGMIIPLRAKNHTVFMFCIQSLHHLMSFLLYVYIMS